MANTKLLYSEFSGFRLDFESKQVTKDGNPIVLTQKCVELLQYLLIQRNRVLRKKELLDSIWEGTFVDEATLTQHMYMLRKAFRSNGAEEFPIETIPKNGYKFVGEVVDIFEEDIENSFPPDNFVKDLFLEEKLAQPAESDPSRQPVGFWSGFISLLISGRRTVVISSFVLILFAAISGIRYSKTDLPKLIVESDRWRYFHSISWMLAVTTNSGSG
ncbi:MAG: winged helix-turn-helix domain-containing protein [Pyrinomonadaceae bacterium]